MLTWPRRPSCWLRETGSTSSSAEGLKYLFSGVTSVKKKFATQIYIKLQFCKIKEDNFTLLNCTGYLFFLSICVKT